VRSASQISPKANAVLGPFYKTELYLNFGHGFHSNDARGVVRGQMLGILAIDLFNNKLRHLMISKH
jgi:hypothetical protein